MSFLVALLAEGGDRNAFSAGVHRPFPVALLAEGGDRNTRAAALLGLGFMVALLAEGGDRNPTLDAILDFVVGRPPRGGRG